MDDHLKVVCFKWNEAGYRTRYGPEQVNTLRSMFARHLHMPHEIVCVTDDAKSLHPDIRVVPLWSDYADVPNPHNAKDGPPKEPNCYRRLKLFSKEMRKIIGPRFVAVDLDIVLTDDVTSLFDRPEEIVLLPSAQKAVPFNGSLILMDAGCRPEVWEEFDPKTSPDRNKSNRCYGSDQGQISYMLKDRKEAAWKIGPEGDGIYFFGAHLNKGGKGLPRDARLISFHGKFDPWRGEAAELGWVKEHYR